MKHLQADLNTLCKSSSEYDYKTPKLPSGQPYTRPMRLSKPDYTKPPALYYYACDSIQAYLPSTLKDFLYSVSIDLIPPKGWYKPIYGFAIKYFRTIDEALIYNILDRRISNTHEDYARIIATYPEYFI